MTEAKISSSLEVRSSEVESAVFDQIIMIAASLNQIIERIPEEGDERAANSILDSANEIIAKGKQNSSVRSMVSIIRKHFFGWKTTETCCLWTIKNL